MSGWLRRTGASRSGHSDAGTALAERVQDAVSCSPSIAAEAAVHEALGFKPRRADGTGPIGPPQDQTRRPPSPATGSTPRAANNHVPRRIARLASAAAVTRGGAAGPAASRPGAHHRCSASSSSERKLESEISTLPASHAPNSGSPLPARCPSAQSATPKRDASAHKSASARPAIPLQRGARRRRRQRRAGRCLGWNDTLKREVGEVFESLGHAQRSLFEYIEVSYDQTRLHSANTPLNPRKKSGAGPAHAPSPAAAVAGSAARAAPAAFSAVAAVDVGQSAAWAKEARGAAPAR